MPKISICIDVSDLDKAVQFYTKALGCELVNERAKYTELVADGLTIYLGEKASATNPLIQGVAVRSYERHWTPVHLDFVVSNLDQCVATVLEMGGSKEGGKSGDWGKIAFCSDPFGNGFCIMQYSN